MTELVKDVDAYYNALDDYFDDEIYNRKVKVSILNQPRELNNHDLSILDDVETLLSHKGSYDFALEALQDAIACAGKKALERTWAEA